jgi:MFS transporter, MFS domain-containing protein family, molybdate-anion transporter
MLDFYELQLVLLTGLCLLSLSVEHFLSRKSSKPKHKELTRAYPEIGKNPNALVALTRQYLVVYAIVMGELIFPTFFL